MSQVIYAIYSSLHVIVSESLDKGLETKNDYGIQFLGSHSKKKSESVRLRAVQSSPPRGSKHSKSFCLYPKKPAIQPQNEVGWLVLAI